VSNPESGKDLVTLVFVLGGLTFGEISAFRLLNKDSRASRDYVVATTHFIHGNKLISEFNESVQSKVDAA
jgi:hypothetical protein